MKNKRIEIFHKYMEIESRLSEYNLIEAKDIDDKTINLRNDIQSYNKVFIVNLITFFTLIPVFILFIQNITLSNDVTAIFIIAIVLVYLFLITSLLFTLLDKIELFFLEKKRKENKELILKYDKNKDNLTKIISEFKFEGKDNLILLYKDLVEKHKGKFNSDFENFEDPHYEFLAFYDIANSLFELKNEDFNKTEVEDVFILYKARNHNYLFDFYEINNI